MKSIVWMKPDKTIAFTRIRDRPYTIDDVKIMYPHFTEKEAKDDLVRLLKDYPKDSKHHAEQMMEQAKKSWELNKKFNPNYPKPEILDWTAIAFDIDPPTHPYLDDARVWSENGISYDFQKCKEIKKQKLRAERKPLFRDLDDQHRAATRNKKDVSAIDAEAQRLADITDLADKAKTIDELDSISVK